MKTNFKLSYTFESVVWNGKKICRKTEDIINKEIDDIHDCGINEVMIASYHMEEPSDFDKDIETKRIGRELEKRGMKANQHHGYAACLAEPGCSQKQVIDNIKQVIDYSVNLRADNLVLHLGKLYGNYSSRNDEKNAFRELIAKYGKTTIIDIIAGNMHEAGSYAQKNGIRIALENLDIFHYLSNQKDLPLVVEKADSPAVGFCLDTGHAHCAGASISKWVAIMGPKLFATHINDNHGNTLNIPDGNIVDGTSSFDEHLPPGFGTIDWVGFILALHEIKYSYTLNFESSCWPGMDRKMGYKHAIDFWRSCEFFADEKSKTIE